MAGMKWYKVWLVVPGTDGDAENGPCEPEWWNDMEQAPDEETECPVCTGAAEVTDGEYAEWKREMEEPVELPFE